MFQSQISNSGNINEIIPNFFLGNMWSTEPNVLNQYGIDCVLNVSDLSTDMNKGRYKLTEHRVIKINDYPNASDKMLREVLPQAMRFLDKYLHPEAPSNKRVLCHCAAGISRSATVVIAWMMKTYGMSKDKALQFVKSRRPIINPNSGFMKTLDVWEKYLKRTHMNKAAMSRRDNRGSKGYNHPGITKHHLFPADAVNADDHYHVQQLRQFERQFSVLPSETNTLQSVKQQAPSYYREFEEKVYSNDDDFKHLY